MCTATIGALASPALGHWGTCPPLSLQQFIFFSSLQSCAKSDGDLVRLPLRTCLFTVLFRVILYAKNNFHAFLCPLAHQIITTYATEQIRCHLASWRGIRTAKYCDQLVCVYLYAAGISRKLRVQTSRNSLYMLARLSSDDGAICNVLPVLWITSCFHV